LADFEVKNSRFEAIFRFLSHRTITTLVADEHCTMVAAWGADALIVEDPPNNYNLSQTTVDSPQGGIGSPLLCQHSPVHI
jgi:hypothetical protein